MQFFKYFIVVFLFCGFTSFGQKVIKHKVKSGESIYSIARKYDVTENEIYELNPKLKGKILGLKTFVEIPNKKYKEEEKKPKENKKVEPITEATSNEVSNQPYLIHIVKTKETLYSLSKEYGISMEDICELNPNLKTDNLKIGAKLKFPNRNGITDLPNQTKALKVDEIATVSNAISSSDIIHKVQSKETLYGISKKYGVSVNDLLLLNPSIRSSLPLHFDLIIKKGELSSKVESTLAIDTTKEVKEVKSIPSENSSIVDVLISKSSEFIGTRYKRGGTTSSGMDCSGLMCATFDEIDFRLPRTSNEQSNYGYKVDRSEAQKGDLIFFTTNGRGAINHVGMITEVLPDEIKFIHASIQSGVIISSTKEEYYAKRFVKINRVLDQPRK